MTRSKKTAVLLLNLGGPQQADDIKPFLVNLFSDRQIIRLGPAPLQPLIARFIAHRRAPKSMANYARIGGGSPILQRTREQALALEKRLGSEGDFLVRPCMCYWHPFAGETLAELQAAGVEHCIALPLYPHYSIATTGSSLADLERAMGGYPALSLSLIKAWPDQPEYIAALAERVEEGLAFFQDNKNSEVRLLYSAHSLPQRFIDEGDPYVEDLQKTIAALEKLTGKTGKLCYQSRSGPVAWLGPSTPEMIQRCAAEGAHNLLILPLSFVSDHVETLVEIEMDYRALAEDLGLRFHSTRPLNDDPLFIEGLAKLVLNAANSAPA